MLIMQQRAPAEQRAQLREWVVRTPLHIAEQNAVSIADCGVDWLDAAGVWI